MGRHLTDADLAKKMEGMGIPVDFKFRKNRKKSEGPTESQIQSAVIKWWIATCDSLHVPRNCLIAIPNGGLRDPVVGAILKREGLLTGASDLICAVMRGSHGALWVEMKKPGGRMSDEQIKFHADMVAQGYAVATCYTYDEAVTTITNYINS